MSLLENTMDKPPVDRPLDSKPVLTDNKPMYRLYPSLPNIDRYNVCVPLRSAAEMLQSKSQLHEDTQSEVCSTDADVRLKAQILILEEQRQELISINERWGKEYRNMVQFYKQQVQDLKALLQQHHSQFEEGTCEEGEKLLLKMLQDKDSRPTGDANSELLKVEKEAQELRVQNGTLTRRGQHQHEEIKRLNKALNEALLTPSSKTLQDVWKHQAEVYKEDFMTERKDREKLKGKYLELENRFRKVRRELHVLKSQATWAQPPNPAHECVCADRVRHQNWCMDPVKQHHVHLQRRCTLHNML